MALLSVGVCNVWSGTHYKTFDGEKYNFNKNCTYYLVKEISEKYNLEITVNNLACDPLVDPFCAQEFTVDYNSNKILFTQVKTSNSIVNAVSIC